MKAFVVRIRFGRTAVFIAPDIETVVYDLILDEDLNKFRDLMGTPFFEVLEMPIPKAGTQLFIQREDGFYYYKDLAKNVTKKFEELSHNRLRRPAKAKFNKDEMRELSFQIKGKFGGKKELAYSSFYEYCQSDDFSKQTKADLLEIAKYLGIDIWEQEATKKQICDAIRNYFTYEDFPKSPKEKESSANQWVLKTDDNKRYSGTKEYITSLAQSIGGRVFKNNMEQKSLSKGKAPMRDISPKRKSPPRSPKRKSPSPSPKSSPPREASPKLTLRRSSRLKAKAEKSPKRKTEKRSPSE